MHADKSTRPAARLAGMTSDAAAMRQLAREMVEIRQSQRRAGSTPQLGTSSIEDGAIQEYDLDGQLKQVIGKQVDGTNTTVQVNGPKPPAPSAPSVEALPGAGKVSWDGTWQPSGGVLGVAVAPLDLARIDVHIVPDLVVDPLTYPSAATISSAGWGDVSLPLEAGDHYAVLVAWTTSGKWMLSEHSDLFTVEAVQLPPVSDGVPPLVAPVTEVISAFDTLWVKITHSPGPEEDPVMGFNIYVNGELTRTTFDTLVAVSLDADGERLPYGADTTITVSAIDLDDEGPLSAPNTGRPLRLSETDLPQSILDDITFAQETADGANHISYSGGPPVDDDRDKDGDTWFQFSGNHLVGQWRHNGSDWVSSVIDQLLLGELDAAKITTGFLNVAVLLQAGAIKSEKIDVASLKAPLAAIGLLVANDVFVSGGIHVTKPSSLAALDINATDGGRWYDSTGKLRISLPMDPSSSAPYLFDGDLKARSLTVLGYSSFQGQNNEISRNSTMTLARGTTAPTSAPTPSPATWEKLSTLPVLPADSSTPVLVGTDWWFTTVGAGATTDQRARPRLGKIDGTTGAITYSALAGMPDDTNYTGRANMTKIGNDLFVSSTRVTGALTIGYSTILEVWRLNATTLAYVGKWTLQTGQTFFGEATNQIFTDGTSVYTSRYKGSPDNPNVQGSTTGQVRRWSVAGGQQGSTLELSRTNTDGTQVAVIPQLAGNFDFGAFRYVAVINNFFGSETVVTDSAGAIQTSESFAPVLTDYDSQPQLAWDGTRFVAWSSILRPHRSFTRKTTLTLSAAYSWYNIGPNTETLVGPVASITIPARSGAVTFTVEAPANDGSADSPDSSRLYVGLSPSTLKLQGAPFVQKVTIAEPNTSTGAAPPTSNTFPDGVAARLQSASGTTYISGDGKIRAADFGAGPANQIAIDALGNGRVGPLQFSTTLNGFGSTTGHMGGTVLGQVAAGVSSTDAVNKGQMDAADAALAANQTPTVAAVTYGSGFIALSASAGASQEVTETVKIGKGVTLYLATQGSGGVTAGQVICTIAAGHRPRRRLRLTPYVSGTAQPCTVNTDGTVTADSNFSTKFMAGTVTYDVP